MYYQETTPNESPATVHPSPDEVRNQLGRMLQCRLFRHSPRLSRFFTFTVEQAVRVAARQLRAKIDLYYLTEGAQDPVLIRYRPGDYIPKFYRRGDASAPQNGQDSDGDSMLRPVMIVEKDRACIRSLTDCLDAINCPIASVTDEGERCVDMLPRVGPCVVVTGINLTGPMNGTNLTRAIRAQNAEAAVVALIPSALDSQLLEELLLAEPDALLYEPVRLADVRIALKIAITRRSNQRRSRADRQESELACV
jgi:CheY-like chemotaxis protein